MQNVIWFSVVGVLNSNAKYQLVKCIKLERGRKGGGKRGEGHTGVCLLVAIEQDQQQICHTCLHHWMGYVDYRTYFQQEIETGCLHIFQFAARNHPNPLHQQECSFALISLVNM